jgi:serine/threonine protein kinase
MGARLNDGALLMAHCEPCLPRRDTTACVCCCAGLLCSACAADNFLFDHRGHLYLTDLGLCKAVEEDEISEVTAHALKEGAAPEGGLSPPTDSHHERPPAAYVRDRKLAYSTVGSESCGALHPAGVPAGVRALPSYYSSLCPARSQHPPQSAWHSRRCALQPRITSRTRCC